MISPITALPSASSRTASHEHRVIAGLAVYKHRVEGVADRRKRMLLRDQHRVDLDLDFSVHQLCNAEKLDHIAEFLRVAISSEVIFVIPSI